MTALEFIHSKFVFCKAGEETLLLEIDEIEELLKKYAELKCKEAARNVRHSACQIAAYCREDPNSIERNIMNIQDKDVIPEL